MKGAAALLTGLLAIGCVVHTDMVLLPAELPAGRVGEPYSVTFTVDGVGGTSVGDMELQGELPDGLTFDWSTQSYTGEMTGTPTEAGTFDLTISTWLFPTMGTSGSGERDYTLTINP